MSVELISDEFTEPERYELHEGPAYRFDANRREFVQVLGAGLLVAISSRSAPAQESRRRRRGSRSRRSEKVSERFHFGEDGVVTVLTGKVDVGQGSRTQIAQAVAEELRLPIDKLRVIMADTELCPDDGGTAGSRTTPSTVPRVRTAAVAARELLSGLAAKRLGVEPSSLKFEDGRFSATSGEQLTLADLAGDEGFASEIDVPLGEDVSVTRVARWRALGTPVPKIDARDVVTGAVQYPSDVIRPQMLYGKVLRRPALGASLRSIDLGPARAMEGVTVVRDGDFVGCAAKTSWLAAQAVEAIGATAQWDMPPQQTSSDTLFEHFKSHANTRGSGWPRPREDEWGDRSAGLAAAEKSIESSYTVAYIQHTPMEPRAAVAEWTDGKLTVWTGSQQPSRVRGELSETFRIPAERVRVIVPKTGGGFGGKHSGEAAVEAARLAKAAGRPVSLRWTREEEFTWAYFRPAGLIEVQAGVDERGRLLVWDFTNYNSGGSAIETPYRVPHGRTRFLAADSPLRQGSYRALASTANAFARESAMDELAHAVGADPLDFRMQHLPDGRLKDVLHAAAEQFDWRGRRANQAPQRGIGLACGTEKGSYVAACAEVEVREDAIRVLSVCQAFECGAIQNPGNLRAQVEGCIIMGLGGALSEEIRFENGRITNASFSEYLVPRMSDAPELDIVLLNRRDLASVGAGETPIIAIAPAVANAVFHATRRRLRSMPLKLNA